MTTDENKKSSEYDAINVNNKVTVDTHKKPVQPTLITSVNQLYSVASNSIANNSFTNNLESSSSTNQINHNSELSNNQLPTLSTSINDNNSASSTLKTNFDFNHKQSSDDEQKCEQRFIRSLRWPATGFDQKHSQKCPGDNIGLASW